MTNEYEERSSEYGAAYEGGEPLEIAELFIATGEWIERLAWSPEAADAAMKALYGVVVFEGQKEVEENPDAPWRDLWRDGIGRTWDSRILEVAIDLHAFAFYGLCPSRRLMEAEEDEDLVIAIDRMVEKMRAILDAAPAGWSRLADVVNTVSAAEARIRLDTGRNVTPEQLAALAKVSLKSIKNLLALKDGTSDLKLDPKGEISRSAALLWLNGRSGFRSSLWQTANASVEASSQPEPTLGEVVFVPVAKDGSWFDPRTCRTQRGYTIGPKGSEITVEDYREALALLERMPTPYWRRPNMVGNRGIVAGTTWQRREIAEIEQLRSPYAEGYRA
ncbi:hypothetical protein [Methylobacterium brachythecii]|uniref:Uncharacterized protein n=1 Tax=Methylobacterium brachythecii TaxID=1176177 RepID=A0A7W6FA05_9HYPH|nr:hypothetical protein [Methylobacterium brachythecii]MBB3905661.1 hypothetical protein [Methylobacterium brachythecii]GLS46940.1 hypothetical protein GCM10007884_49400 [Methylobacterium brachythecii]